MSSPLLTSLTYTLFCRNLGGLGKNLGGLEPPPLNPPVEPRLMLRDQSTQLQMRSPLAQNIATVYILGEKNTSRAKVVSYHSKHTFYT